MIHNSALETARLFIRPFMDEDVGDLVALFDDPKVARFVDDGGPLSLESASLWVLRSGENLQRHGYGTGAVIERESGNLIGWAGYARPEDGPEQIIYGLAAAYWRMGYGKEIAAALLEFADMRGIDPVFATIDPANEFSIRLLLGQGFRLVEECHGGEPDSNLYRRDRPASR